MKIVMTGLIILLEIGKIIVGKTALIGTATGILTEIMIEIRTVTSTKTITDQE
jgi:hypothetical protein